MRWVSVILIMLTLTLWTVGAEVENAYLREQIELTRKRSCVSTLEYEAAIKTAEVFSKISAQCLDLGFAALDACQPVAGPQVFVPLEKTTP